MTGNSRVLLFEQPCVASLACAPLDSHTSDYGSEADASHNRKVDPRSVGIQSMQAFSGYVLGFSDEILRDCSETFYLLCKFNFPVWTWGDEHVGNSEPLKLRNNPLVQFHVSG